MVAIKRMIHLSSVYRRSVTLALIATGLALLSLPALAQASRDWSAWFVIPATGEVVQVGRAGDVTGSFYLPIPQAFNAVSPAVAVSSDGRFVAYIATDTTLPEFPNTQLFVYDRTVDASRLAYDISGATATSIDIRPTPQAFNPSNRAFAFGLSHAAGWQIVVGSALDGAIIATLDSADAPAVREGGTPVVLEYVADRVAFVMVSANGTPASLVYLWDVARDEIVTDTAHGTALHGDHFLFTGERLLPLTRDNRTGLIVVSLNGQETPIYFRDDATVTGGRFIADGAQALALVRKASGETAFAIIRRDGRISEIIGDLDDIFGTPDGFAGTFAVNGGAVGLAHVSTLGDDFGVNVLWSTPQAGARLIHIQTAGIPSGGLPPFTAQAGLP